VGGGLGLYIRSGIGFKVIARSSESGVEFLFVDIKLRNRVVLVATIYRPPNTLVVYHLLDGEYGLQALEEICANFLPLYGEVVFLEILMLICWILVILCFLGSWISWRCLCYAMWLFFRPRRVASGKLSDLFGYVVQ
jgi:hypothetical protein